jgi:FtsP/CotA-like multicopper oxidase with cupredoxin domain
MNFRNKSAKCKFEKKSSLLEAAAILFLAGILCTILASNGSAANESIELNSSALKSSDSPPMNEHANLDARQYLKMKMQLPADRKAAAQRYKASREEAMALARKAAPGVAPTVAPLFDPGGIPHYFGPYPNYANSPMPTGSIASITVTNGGSGYVSPTVEISDVYGTGSGATATATVVGGVITGITVNTPGSGYTGPIVTITDATGAGATATATLGGPLTGGIRKFIDPLPNLPIAVPDQVTYPAGGKGYTSVPTIEITDATGTGASATAVLTGDTVSGVTINNGGSGYSANPTITFVGGGTTPPVTHAIGKATVVGGVITAITLLGCDYYEIALVEYSQKMHTDLPATRLRGYVQLGTTVVPGAVPLLDANSNPILKPDNTPAMGVVAPKYMGPIIVSQRDHPVRIKFYNLLAKGAGGDLFLPVDTTVMGSGMGPNMIMPDMVTQPGGAIVEITTMMPHNLAEGQLIMLHGFVPDAYNGEYRVLGTGLTTNTFQILLKTDPAPAVVTKGHIMELYTQNRATIHLHGGYVPWISDGTPHQWITPAGETTSYPKGVSMRNVPDMPDPGDGSMTFFYNNQQSARLMFYHDHSYGITRLNVYAGEAAGYLITDQVEKDMIDGTNVAGINPNSLQVLPDTGIPLVIQDKTFVDENTIGAQDPTWNWGTAPRDPNTGKISKANTGDLWMPHVYMTNQNPWDIGGMNAFGRWHYGPWFWPPTTNIAHGPVTNPYVGPNEPPMIPGVPHNSMAMESFVDTPVVNGVAYPYLNVEPKAYRFRILNAADDRFFNLQLYVASNIISGITVTNGGSGYVNPTVTITDPTGKGATATATVVNGVITGVELLTVGSGYTAPAVTFNDPVGGGGAVATATLYTTPTEVGMVPASNFAGLPAGWPTDGRDGGVPDPAKAGPSFIQIGTEGGFLPAPVELPNLPVNWNMDQTNFDFGNVNQGTVLLGPAERADVIVDFSAYAGKTLILYNDAPAPFPAIDPRYDYYTNHPDQTDTGGAPTTQAGYGPNTRTVMQIQVAAAPIVPYDLANLQAVFAKDTLNNKRGVFEASQDDIIVPQAEYNSAYDRTDLAVDPYVRIFENSKTFQTLAGSTVTIPFESKAIQDEMGEAFETDFGRMSGFLGLEVPFTGAGNQNFLLYPFPSPPVEIIKGSVYGTQIGSLGDGTQIWKITHNGVDTHTIHVHLFNAQLINRVAWDNAIRVPDLNELGWKETFRVNPLQDTIIALRPVAPTQPFDVPNSERLIDPTMPEGAELKGGPLGFQDPSGEPVTVLNHVVNFGWEYMVHCHLLSHEEMDMMHAIAFAVPPQAPSDLVATVTISGSSLDLNWVDNSISETGFLIQRAKDAAFTVDLTEFSVGPNVVTYTDTSIVPGTTYYYRVRAVNLVGDTTVYPAPAVGFPQKTAYSAWSNNAIAPEVLTISAIGTGNDLQVKQRIGGVWGAWNNLGGIVQNIASTSSAGSVYVFARGGENALWYRNWNGVAWSDWQTLSGWMDLLDSTSSGGSVYAFARGGDNALWYRNWNGVTWAEWQSLGGFTKDIDVTSPAGSVYAFARGGDDALWYRNWNGAAWSDWQSLGGFITDLDSTSSGGSVYAFARGGDDALWYRNWNGAAWSDWQSLGGFITDLACTSSASGVFVFARGGDNALWYRNWNGVAWSDWHILGGQITDLDAVSSGGNVGVHVIGTDGALWNINWDGTAWSAWQNQGGSITSLDATLLN